MAAMSTDLSTNRSPRCASVAVTVEFGVIGGSCADVEANARDTLDRFAPDADDWRIQIAARPVRSANGAIAGWEAEVKAERWS